MRDTLFRRRRYTRGLCRWLRRGSPLPRPDREPARMLHNIQISRGIAAAMVLLAHANLLIDKTLFEGVFIIGWCGVDFFVSVAPRPS